MSMQRFCPNCYRTEGVRLNFGSDRAAESQFHKQQWCDCGYFSPEEMMQDQDLGFEDPRWVQVTTTFLNEYYRRLSLGRIPTKDEHVRYFMKLLNRSLRFHGLSVEIVRYSEPAIKQPAKKTPKSNIFDKSFDLVHLPTIESEDTVNSELVRAYKHSRTIIDAHEKRSKRSSRVIVTLLVLLIIVSILLVS
jgi:hypothetical protein